jgi:hypothetical protein
MLCSVAIAIAALSPAPGNACTTPNRPAKVVVLDEPVWPPEPAKEIGLGALDFYVLVGVNASGKVSAARMYKPLDAGAGYNNAVLKAALASEYAPEIRACKPVAGHVIVHFVWMPS